MHTLFFERREFNQGRYMLVETVLKDTLNPDFP